MNNRMGIKRSFSLAEWSGMAACLLAIVLFPLDPRIAAAPPVIFLLLCLVAPFLPAFSFFLPIISRGRRDDPAVALGHLHLETLNHALLARNG